MRFIALILVLLWTGTAFAHHPRDGRMRVVLIEEQGTDTIVHVRMPAPLLFAREAMARRSPYDPVDAPFIRPEIYRDIYWVHRLDMHAVAGDPVGFADRIGTTLEIALDGNVIDPAAIDFAIQPADALPPFGTPTEAAAALSGETDHEDPIIGDTFVDARFRITGTGTLSIGSAVVDAALPSAVFIESTFIDFRADPPARTVRVGALDRPIALVAP